MKIRNTIPAIQNQFVTVVKIDKGIPMPQVKNTHGNTVYPWKTMEVGDSFLFRSQSKQNAYSQSNRHSGILSPKKFVIRNTDAGYRCWRIA